MMSPMILPSIAGLLNRYLQCDPEMQSRLEKYQKRVVRATVTPFDWIFYIKIEDKKIILLDQYEDSIDASFRADVMALTQSALSSQTSINPGIELQGDINLIQSVMAIFKNVEIDWEGCLAQYAGDTIAHAVGNMARDIKELHDTFFNTGILNMKEYLQEEVNLLIHPHAVEDFCKDVDRLRDDVDRIDAKLKIIEVYAEEN